MNGIGGRTIAEAQEVVSYPEFLKWVQYRKKRGSLNLGMRIERGSALLATLYANAHAGKDKSYSVYDFMPHMDEPELSLDEAMEKWS